MARRSGFRRSAGTATPLDIIRRGFRPPSSVALSADISAMFFSPGSRFFDYAAFDVITCQLADGKLDLAVPRPDVRLVLHYLGSTSAASSDRSD